jgi:hypothetical protein
MSPISRGPTAWSVKRTDASPAAKFFERVEVRDTGCWEWVGPVDQCGYGVLSYLGRRTMAHRAMVMLLGIIIPPGKIIMHKCDNPPCVNPAHLRVGTHHANHLDCVRKGRYVVTHGEAHGGSKLTARDVRKLRKMYAAGLENPSELGRRFGVHRNTALKAIRRDTWRTL